MRLQGTAKDQGAPLPTCARDTAFLAWRWDAGEVEAPALCQASEDVAESPDLKELKLREIDKKHKIISGPDKCCGDA